VFFIYLRLVLHEIISDVKDIEIDKKYNLLTLPIILSQKKIFCLLNFLNLLSFLLLICGVYFNLFPSFSLIFIIVFIYTIYYSIKIKKIKTNEDFLFSVIIDGEYILWSVVTLIGKYFYGTNLFTR
jgi:4-hydroxybenzoate polyprenyltransferase